jgi:hypothetical protein
VTFYLAARRVKESVRWPTLTDYYFTLEGGPSKLRLGGDVRRAPKCIETQIPNERRRRIFHATAGAPGSRPFFGR